MKKISASILSAIMMLSMIFSSSVFAANDQTQTSAWDSFVGLFTKATTAGTMGVEYAGWVQDVGQTPTDGTYITGPGQLGTPGLSRRLEGFQIKLTGTIPTGASIKYIVHVQDYGWMGNIDDTTTWKANGTYAGTKDESKRIEDIKIVLVGADGKTLPGYSVSYKGHVQNEGDTAWVSDGASFNNTGKSQRLECLEVKVVQTKADMTAYNAAVAQANSAKAADYTTASYKALTDAVAANVVTDADTQAKVDAAAAAINAAYAGLVKAADLDAYNAAVAQAGTAKAADYTTASYKALTDAVAANVVTKDDTQAKVDAAAKAINDAYAALVKAADLTAYNAAVTKANAVVKADYTDASYAALTKALADNVVTKDNTAAQVKTATDAITAATDALVKVANMDAYNAAVTKANAAVKADYTADSYAALQTALTSNVVTNQDTQAKVDEATKAINGAYDGLELVLKVSTVVANDTREIDVVYNRELKATEKTEAVKFANISVYKQGALTANIFTTGANAVANVLDDNKTVRLTLKNTTPLVNFTTANKIVIKKAVGLQADYTKTDLAVSDTTLPTLVSAASTGSQDIVLTFSEPLDSTISNPSNIVLNNGAIGVNSAVTYNDSKRQVTITAATALAAGDYTVTIKSGTTLADAAGYKVVPASVTFTQTPSTGAPTATVKSSTENTVTIEFSSPINSATLVGNTDVLFTHTYNTSANQVNGSAVVNNPAGDNKTFVVTFSQPLPPGEATMWMKYTTTATDANKVKDSYGNIVAPAAFTVSTVADTTAPTATVTGVSGSNTKIDIQFSEPVSGANVASNFTLKKGTTSVNFSGPVSLGDNKYQITANAPLQGDYTLAIKNIKDTSAAQNAMGTQTFTVSVGDTIAPFVTAQDGTTAGSNFFTQGANTKVRVYFSEAMNTTDLATLTNYQNVADSSANATVATPSTDGKSVYLEFANNVSGNLIVGSVHDAAGNTIAGFAATLTSASGSTVGLDTTVTNSIVAATTSSVKVYLNDAVVDVTVADFEIRKDGSTWVSPASYTNDTSSGKSVITLTLATANVLGFDAANAQVRTVSSAGNFGTTVNAKNQFGLGVNISATAITDKITPELITTEPIKTMDANGNGKIDHISITFKEAMQDLYVTPDRFTVDGYTVTDAFAATVAPDGAGRTGATVGNSVTVYLAVTENITTTDSNATPSVTIATGLRDVADNIYAGTTLTAIDKAAPVMTSVTNNAGTLTATFSEPVYTANDTTGDLTTTDFTYTVTGSTTEALLSVSHVAGANTATMSTTTPPSTGKLAAASATSIYDAAANAMATTAVTIV